MPTVAEIDYVSQGQALALLLSIHNEGRLR